MKNLTFAVLAAATLLGTSAAHAVDEYNVSNALTINGAPLGFKGFDPVAALKGAEPTFGNPDFYSNYDGVDYYFATEESKAAFDANPEAMLPEFGGFCAFGVFAGKKLDGDARFADIVDGKLYLFVNQGVLDRWMENKESILAGAEEKWPEIINTPVENL